MTTSFHGRSTRAIAAIIGIVVTECNGDRQRNTDQDARVSSLYIEVDAGVITDPSLRSGRYNWKESLAVASRNLFRTCMLYAQQETRVLQQGPYHRNANRFECNRTLELHPTS